MKILICTDGSTDGFAAVHFGGKVALGMGAKVTLLWVKACKRAQEMLVDEQSVLQEMGLDPDIVCGQGSAQQEIPLVEQETFDLAVVGYQDRGFLRKFFLGSDAIRIAQAACVPFLLVREPQEKLDRILIGISGGGFTQACAELGGRLAVAFDAHVTLLHVSATPVLMYAGLDQVQTPLEEFLQTETKEAEALKQAAVTLTNMNVETDVRLAHGLAERELLRALHEDSYDLLVIGSAWAADRFQRLTLPNTTKKILLDTRRPVLVVRP